MVHLLYFIDYKLFIDMKSITLQLFLAIAFTISLSSQVTKVDYLLDYNCETNLYEVKLKILEGSATTIPQRAQFNAQLTIVVPTGTDFEIVELVNPINDNQLYQGTVNTIWSSGAVAISPNDSPLNDFHPLTPQLSPASFYNDLAAGDEVVLFICKIGDSNEYNSNYRFFNNDTDNISMIDYGNMSNGFTMGSPLQIYNGNDYKACTTETQEEKLSSVVAYPNPFTNEIILELDENIKSLKIYDQSGKVVYSKLNQESGTLRINSSLLPLGAYILQLQTVNTIKTKRFVKL
jgi:hypothetical protein